MASDDRFFIGPGLRDKLREVIRASDSARASRGGEIPTVLQNMTPPSGGGVAEAYFTGGWVKGATKQIVFLANTATTATAINLIRSVPVNAGGQTARNCTVTLRTVAGASANSYVLLNTEC